MGDEGVIYLVRNDALWKDNIFKVGKSSNFKTRLSSYGKIRVLDTFSTKFITMCERDVLKDFSTKFPKAFAQEYFLCSEEDAVNTFTKAKERILSSMDKMERKFLASYLCQYEDEQTKILSRETLPKERKAKDISKELSDIADMKEKEKLVEVSISSEISYEEREELLEKKDLSREETASLRKYAIAEHYHMEQKDVTVEFLETYKKQWTAFRTLCLTLGEKEKVDKRLKEELEREIEEKKREGLRRRAYLKKVVLLREVLSDIGFVEWHKEKKIRQKEYAAGVEKALKRMSQDREIFVILFETIPAKPEFFLRWLNGQLRYLFGFTIKKTSRNKNFSLYVKFCVAWRFTEDKESEEEIFIPLVGPGL